jgi:hypothetical protein
MDLEGTTAIDEDTSNLVPNGRNDVDETRRVEGGVRLLSAGSDGRWTKGSRRRSERGVGGQGRTAAAAQAAARSSRTLGACERMGEGE